MLKFKLYYDKDEEEAWLREMSAEGWAFKQFFLGFYTFEPCEPGEYNYQIDLLDHWSGKKADYAAFMADLGVEVIDQWWRWVYLRKKAADGSFEMYTDAESKINLYHKIKNFFLIFLIIEGLCFLMEFIAAIETGKFMFVVLTIVLGAMALAILHVVWKCQWKIGSFQS